MKTFALTFLILLSFQVNAQNLYTIPYSMNLFDIDGDNFLAYELNGNQLMIHEYDNVGNLIWKDSTTFLGDPVDVKYYNRPYNFPETDDYIFILVNKIGTWFTDDPAEYHFVKFSTLAQGITLEKLDTLLGQGLYPMSYRDTSIFLFNKFNTPDPDEIETLDLDESLNIAPYAAQDSIEIYTCYNTKFYELNDSIVRFCETPWSAEFEQYTNSISFQNYYYYTLPSGIGYSSIAYFDTVGVDSVLLVYQTTYSGTPARDWGYVWLDYSLSYLSSFEASAPTQSGMYYTMWQPIVAGDKIYTMAALIDGGAEPFTIFVYDFNFNLICEIPLGPNNSEFTLIELNDSPYLGIKDQSDYNYYQIDDCLFTNAINSIDASSFLIFPNPAANELTIKRTSNEAATIEVLDLTGKIIINSSTNYSVSNLDISMLKSGVYNIKIQCGDEIIVNRFVKQ